MARGLPETWTGFYLRPVVKMLNVYITFYLQSIKLKINFIGI